MNMYISEKILFSEIPYGIQPDYTTKISLYKNFGNNESTLINMHAAAPNT